MLNYSQRRVAASFLALPGCRFRLDAHCAAGETSWPDSPNQAPPTFLFQLVTLLNKRLRTATGRYVYSEQEYLLALERQQPGRSRERLVAVRGKDPQPPHKSRNEFPPLARKRFIRSPGRLRIPDRARF